ARGRALARGMRRPAHRARARPRRARQRLRRDRRRAKRLDQPPRRLRSHEVIARIEPLTTTRRLNGPFDYLLPEGPLEVGSIVRIPFGHQKLDGVVVELTTHSELEAERLIAPTRVESDSVPPDLVDLALWMAVEYCSTPARALALVTPPPGK